MNSNLEQLHIRVDRDGRSEVVTLAGELDPHTAPQLEHEITTMVGNGALDVVLDLRDLQFIDSSGLRVLIAAHRDLGRRGGSLTLRSPSDTARRLLEITGLVDHITIVEG